MATEPDLGSDGAADINSLTSGLEFGALSPVTTAPSGGSATPDGATSSTDPLCADLEQRAGECVDCLMECYDLILDGLDQGVRECSSHCQEACRCVLGQLELDLEPITQAIAKADGSVKRQLETQLTTLNGYLYDAEALLGIEYTGGAVPEQPIPECPAGSYPVQQPDGSWKCVAVEMPPVSPVPVTRTASLPQPQPATSAPVLGPGECPEGYEPDPYGGCQQVQPPPPPGPEPPPEPPPTEPPPPCPPGQDWVWDAPGMGHCYAPPPPPDPCTLVPTGDYCVQAAPGQPVQTAWGVVVPPQVTPQDGINQPFWAAGPCLGQAGEWFSSGVVAVRTWVDGCGVTWTLRGVRVQSQCPEPKPVPCCPDMSWMDRCEFKYAPEQLTNLLVASEQPASQG